DVGLGDQAQQLGRAEIADALNSAAIAVPLRPEIEIADKPEADLRMSRSDVEQRRLAFREIALVGRGAAEIADDNAVAAARRRRRRYGGEPLLLAIDRIRNDGGWAAEALGDARERRRRDRDEIAAEQQFAPPAHGIEIMPPLMRRHPAHRVDVSGKGGIE